MLNYKILNQNNIGRLPCLVFIAGFTANYEVWNPLVNHLTGCSITNPLLLIDNLGAGASHQPEEMYTTQLMANEIIKVLNTLSIKSLFIIGHSLGGAIAQYMALTKEFAVERLFLLGSFSLIESVRFIRTRFSKIYLC